MRNAFSELVHLTAQLPKAAPIEKWPESKALFAHPGVIDVAPFVEGQAVLDFNNTVWVVRVMGVEPRQPSGSWPHSFPHRKPIVNLGRSICPTTT